MAKAKKAIKPIPDPLRKYVVYTDGSFRPPHFGSYVFVIVENDAVAHSRVEKVYNTTINQMELMAIADTLRHFKEPADITIYSDSQYAVFSVTKWSHGWKRNNWMTMMGQPVKNREILEEILELSKPHTVTVEWVRGHNGNKYNTIADTLAQTATREMIQGNNAPIM